MIVKEIFFFQDGRTVFVGEVDTQQDLIKPCICDIYVEGYKYSTLYIEGEMIPNKKFINHRAISTTDNINVNSLPFKTNQVEIIYNQSINLFATHCKACIPVI